MKVINFERDRSIQLYELLFSLSGIDTLFTGIEEELRTVALESKSTA